MGRATRWIMDLLGMKKEKKQEQQQSEKKRWSFGKSGRGQQAHVPANITEAVWLRSYISETEKEQTKHAIAVAAATAAAADAAVAAAQAAAVVVRLTSHGRGSMFHGGRERSAALKVQSVFKGYLARKALRALKGLVKLQALVRGFLVRKRAAATLHCMQSLLRAQTAVRSQRARRSFTQDSRRSIEKNCEARSEFPSKRLSTTSHETWCNHALDDIPKIVQIDTCNSRSRSSRRIEDYSSYPTISPEQKKYQDFEWIFNGEECRFSTTAQSTPRFANCVRSSMAPNTPAKSVCGDIMFRPYSNHPSYMANTQSFNAKLRSHSAPKQRPEPGPKKRLSLQEIMTSRASLSGVKMQRSCSQVVQETLNVR